MVFPIFSKSNKRLGETASICNLKGAEQLIHIFSITAKIANIVLHVIS